MNRRLTHLVRRMAEEPVDAAVIARPENIAALFDGAQSFNGTRHEPPGRVALVIPAAGEPITVVGNHTEVTRLVEEELTGFPVEARPFIWDRWDYAACVPTVLAELNVRDAWDDTGRLGQDCNRLLVEDRYPLTPEEARRLTALGRDVAEVLKALVDDLRPGVTEMPLAGRAHARLMRCGALPDLVFVAFDDRIARFRHAKPGPATLDRLAFLSLTAHRRGLFCSASRFVSLGPPTDAQQRLVIKCGHIEATALAASQPGRTFGEVFEAIRTAYADLGHPGGEQVHHVGGGIGFLGRDPKAAPGQDRRVTDCQALVYNPVIGPAKSEDTFLLTAEGGDVRLEPLTADDLWPHYRVEVAGRSFRRPGILVLE